MKTWRRYWYWIGGIIFMALALVMVLWGARYLTTVRTILIFSWMAMLAHQVEEYGFPGGFPSIANMGVLKEKEAPYQYIFNAQQCFICNVFFCYAFYIIAMFLVFILPAIIRRNRHNPYPFTEEEMYGYKKEDVLEIYNNGEPSLLEQFGLHL